MIRGINDLHRFILILLFICGQCCSIVSSISSSNFSLCNESTTTTNRDATIHESSHFWEDDKVAEDDILLRFTDTTTTRSGFVWYDMSVVSHHHHHQRLSKQQSSLKQYLLHKSSGFVPNGHVCGILGPSGAGKSTFLKALVGGDGVSNKQWYRQGHVGQFHYDDHYDNKNDTTHSSSYLVPITSQQVAWLQQHDNFFELLTVQETLQLAAFLELPHWNTTQRQILIQTKLDALGLSSVAHRPVGNYHTTTSSGSSSSSSSSSSHTISSLASRFPGWTTTTTAPPPLSGGERHRLAVALELLTNKELLLADEPTTGLDTTMSTRVVQLIRDTVQSLHIPAFVVLHQPRSKIWNELLDDVILMASGGHVCYSGPRSNVRSYFDRIGYPCPSDTNPAEFYVDLISIDPEDPKQAAIDQQRVQRIVEHYQNYQKEQFLSQKQHRQHNHPHIKKEVYTSSTSSSTTTTTTTADQPHHHFVLRVPQWFLRFTALFQRSIRQNVRDKVSIMARMLFSISNAWLLTQLYPTVIRHSPPTAHSLADRAALVTTSAIVICSMAYMKTADLLEQEYPVVVREHIRQQYSSIEYILAKALAEIPLDTIFAGVFSTVLKGCTGLRIGWWPLMGVFSLLTAAGASLGFALGSWFAADGLALQAGLPFVIVLMLVGVINPSGVDPNASPIWITQWMKRISPFTYAIQAIMVAEFKDMEFVSTGPWWSKFQDLPRLGAMAMVRNGNQVLEALGLSQVTYANAMKQLAYLTGLNLLWSWLGLWFRRPITSSSSSSSSMKSSKKKTKNNDDTSSSSSSSPIRVRGKWSL